MFFEAFFLMGMARAALLFVPFRKLAPTLGKQHTETPKTSQTEALPVIRKIKTAIRRAAKITPWQSKCFVQAIAGKIMLRRRQLESTIYLGVCKNGNDSKKLKAHAWLRSGNMILTGREGMGQFTVVSTFGE